MHSYWVKSIYVIVLNMILQIVEKISYETMSITFEFFTVYTRLAEMAKLASTGLKTPKKEHQTNWATDVFAT